MTLRTRLGEFFRPLNSEYGNVSAAFRHIKATPKKGFASLQTWRKKGMSALSIDGLKNRAVLRLRIVYTNTRGHVVKKKDFLIKKIGSRGLLRTVYTNARGHVVKKKDFLIKKIGRRGLIYGLVKISPLLVIWGAATMPFPGYAIPIPVATPSIPAGMLAGQPFAYGVAVEIEMAISTKQMGKMARLLVAEASMGTLTYPRVLHYLVGFFLGSSSMACTATSLVLMVTEGPTMRANNLHHIGCAGSLLTPLYANTVLQ